MEKTEVITASGIRPTPQALIVLIDDREIAVPWERCSRRLAEASEAERLQARLSPGGYGIHWPLLDEDLSIHGIIRGL